MAVTGGLAPDSSAPRGPRGGGGGVTVPGLAPSIAQLLSDSLATSQPSLLMGKILVCSHADLCGPWELPSAGVLCAPFWAAECLTSEREGGGGPTLHAC